MDAGPEHEIGELEAALDRAEDPAVRERLAVLLAQSGRIDEAIAGTQRVIARLPERPKAWRAVLAVLAALEEPEARAEVWRAALELWRSSAAGGEAADAFGAELASRLFAWLAEIVQSLEPSDPWGIQAAWRLARRLYADPAFAELARRRPERFAEFVRVAGEDRYLRAAEKQGSDLSPCVEDAIALCAPAPRRDEMLAVVHADMRAYSQTADPQAAAARLLQDPEFHRPVVICGFHHSGTRLLARQLAAVGVRQRINVYQYEWSYVIQLNSILQPGCMDPAKLGPPKAEAALLSPERLAWRMALAGLEPGQSWGFKDPRNALNASAWLEAFPRARIVHLLRDPVATIGTLPELYGQFVRTDARRPTPTAFWIELWEAYVQAARRSMATAEAAVEIRFEDLCADPVGALGRIAVELGLASPVTAEALQDIRIDQAKSSLGERLHAAGPISAPDLQRLEALALRYGYG